MSDTLTLTIRSIKGKLLSQNVQYVKCNSVVGDTGIYPNHTPTIVDVQEGVVEFENEAQKVEAVYISDSICKISKTEIIFLVDFMFVAADFDKEALEEESKNSGKAYKESVDYTKKQLALNVKKRADSKLRVLEVATA